MGGRCKRETLGGRDKKKRSMTGKEKKKKQEDELEVEEVRK